MPALREPQPEEPALLRDVRALARAVDAAARGGRRSPSAPELAPSCGADRAEPRRRASRSSVGGVTNTDLPALPRPLRQHGALLSVLRGIDDGSTARVAAAPSDRCKRCRRWARWGLSFLGRSDDAPLASGRRRNTARRARLPGRAGVTPAERLRASARRGHDGRHALSVAHAPAPRPHRARRRRRPHL